MQTFEPYLDYVKVILFFGLASPWHELLAQSKGYYQLPFRATKEKGVLSLSSVFVVFAIYLSMTMLVSLLFVHLTRAIYSTLQPTTSAGRNGMDPVNRHFNDPPLFLPVRTNIKSPFNTPHF